MKDEEVVRYEDFNELNSVGIFAGPLLTLYREVTVDELKEMMASGTRFVLVDALDSDSFAQEHIKGALNLPVDFIERDASGVLREDDLIVVYSRAGNCMISAVAADKLFNLGYENVARFTDGLEGWAMARLPFEVGLHKGPQSTVEARRAVAKKAA